MSTKDRLSRLTADLIAPSSTIDSTPSTLSAEVEARFPPVTQRPTGSKTGPGQMLAFRGQMLAAEGELGKLREQLKQFEDSLPTKKLDSKLVVPSRWANRHEASFATPEFERFKADIAHAGGNVQPILVRPTDDERYEIIFGHRRHRACLELGIEVLAAIWTAPMSDADLFAAMDRENRERADLSAWEQGAMYRQALDSGLFPSQRRLAESLGLSHTWVRKALVVGDLTPPVVDCFRSPLDIQYRHAEMIQAALESDRKTVLRRAERIRQLPAKLLPAAVVDSLLGVRKDEAPKPQILEVDGKPIGKWNCDGAGRITIQIHPGVVPADRLGAVMHAVQRVLVNK